MCGRLSDSSRINVYLSVKSREPGRPKRRGNDDVDNTGVKTQHAHVAKDDDDDDDDDDENGDDEDDEEDDEEDDDEEDDEQAPYRSISHT